MYWRTQFTTPACAPAGRSCCSTAVPCPRTWWKVSSSGTSAGRSRVLTPSIRAPSSARAEARSFSMKSASWRSICSLACLRVLDDRSVRRVGGTRDRQLDVRIISATNRDLSALVAAKQFRSDLYFRLGAAVVHLPPLRDRLEDLPLLIPQLLADLGRPDIRVAPATLDLLRAHRWPGNVRELKNTLACALTFADTGVMEPRHLKFVAPASENSVLDRFPLSGKTLASIEQVAIRQTLAQTRGNKSSGREAARYRRVDALREAEEVRRLNPIRSPTEARGRGRRSEPRREPEGRWASPGSEGPCSGRTDTAGADRSRSGTRLRGGRSDRRRTPRM